MTSASPSTPGASRKVASSCAESSAPAVSSGLAGTHELRLTKSDSVSSRAAAST